MARNNKSKQTKQAESVNQQTNNEENETGEIEETKVDQALPNIETLGINSPDQNADESVTMGDASNNPISSEQASSLNDTNLLEMIQTQTVRINKLHADQNQMRQEVMFIKDKLNTLSSNQKNIESRLEASVGTLKERYSTLDSKLDSVLETFSGIKSNMVAQGRVNPTLLQILSNSAQAQSQSCSANVDGSCQANFIDVS